jgi:hypothetical protein
MWDDKGWKRITAEEAARLHPGGTVSAHSEMFMCELCGQYVTLTDGEINVRYFKHSRGEKNKDCPERTFGPGVTVNIDLSHHELPIRIVNVSRGTFAFEMGFHKIPLDLYESDFQIEVVGSRNLNQAHIYNRERFNCDRMTYLSIGDAPSTEYVVNIKKGDKKLSRYWPNTVLGMNPEGTLFDVNTGIKLQNDSDVVIGKKYYLLMNHSLSGHYGTSITANEVCKKTISMNTWRIYEIVANDYDKNSAMFFLDYHLRLTDSPVSVTPVWPVCLREPYVVKHDSESVVLFINGNAQTSVFPTARTRTYTCSIGKAVEVYCNSRQQLISTGRVSVLDYSYFWREPLTAVTKSPSYQIIDIHGTAINSGENLVVPDKGIIVVTLPYDGIAIKSKNGVVIEKRNVHAEISTDIEDVVYGVELSVLVGRDVVWAASFKKETRKKESNNATLVGILSTTRGQNIPLPSSIGTIYNLIEDYPDLRKWLEQCIKRKTINENAYRKLRAFVLNEISSKQGGSL